MVNMIDKVFGMMGFSRAKSYERLWAMAQENRLMRDQLTNEYEQMPAVYKAIKAIGDNVPQAKLKFYRRDNDELYDRDNELNDLFRQPNSMMSFSELLEATIIFHRLCGEGFWIYIDSVGQATGRRRLPAEIWTWHPKNFKERIDRDSKMLVGWEFRRQFYPITSIMHFRDFNPNHDIRGLSPLKPAKTSIDIDWQSILYNKAFFRNDATPSFALGTEKTLSKQQRDRTEAWWKKEFGGATNAFKMAILEEGLKPISIAHSGRNMQFMEQKKFLREEIIGIWRVPKSMFSINEDTTYATFLGHKKLFWTDTIQPILKRLAEEINAQFFHQFMPEIYCKFDFSNVDALKEEIKEKMDTASKMFGMGIPFNVINERLELGFDEIPGGDVGYLPFNLVPISMIGQDLGGGQQQEPAKAVKEIEDKNLAAEAAREKIWKGFLRLHEPTERRMAAAVRSYMYGLRTRLLAGIQSKSAATKLVKEINFVFNWDAEEKILVEKMAPHLKRAILQGADFAESIAGGEVDQAVLDMKLQSFLAVKADKIKTIPRRMQTNIVPMIEESIRNGETVADLAGKVRTLFNNYTPFASMRIARTETTSALNGGSLQYYEATGAKTKTWISAADEATRDSHLAVHGKTVQINENFDNGLPYPGGDGPAEEVINCRCTLITRDTAE